MDQLLISLSTEDEVLINSRWDCMVRNQCSNMLLYYFMLLKITEKILLNRNIMNNHIVHRIHGYWYCLLLLLLFTVYTITVSVTV